MHIENAMIEVTRKCNMACAHCLRGDAQNREISNADIDMFFSKVESIGNLTITGGEPSLASHKIEYIVESARKHNVNIQSFYIATNAKVVSDAFLTALIKLYCYCSDNEMSALNYSDDDYHDELEEENIKRLSVFAFTAPKYNGSVNTGRYEINEGRAKENSIGVREESGINPDYFDMESYVDMEYETITGETNVYLNAKGNIVCGCDWSYKSQDRKGNVICKVGEMSMDAFINYFKRFERKAA